MDNNNKILSCKAASRDPFCENCRKKKGGCQFKKGMFEFASGSPPVVHGKKIQKTCVALGVKDICSGCIRKKNVRIC